MFEVTQGVPADWDRYAGEGPAAGRARWIEFGQSWFPGPYQTFALRGADGECLVAMGGTVLRSPGAVPRRDPYSILTGRVAHLGLFDDGRHPWPATLEPADVHPCLMLTYPNYAAFPVGTMRPDVLREFVDSVVAWAKEHGIASIALLFLTPPAAPLLPELVSFGFTVGQMGSRCDMDVTWSSFDGYLDHLPSKRRVEVRRELRQLESSGLVRASRPLAEHEPELLDLRCRLIEKYDESVDPAAEAAIFDKIRRHVPPSDITVFTVSSGSRTVSFSLFIQDGEEWTAMLTGSSSPLGYFSTIFYQPAAQAPSRGVRLLAYGYGSLDTKRRRGCRVSPYHAASLRL